MKFSSRDSQRGFSALGIFIAGLAVIVLMGSTGFFQGPKSSTGEENVSYTVADQQSSNTKGLQMTKVNFSTPTPSPTPIPQSGCFADSCQPIGSECNCPDLHITCKDGKCLKVEISKSGPLYQSYTCANVDAEQWCTGVCGKTIEGDYCLGKPVIYLYPEKPTLVNVTVETAGKIVVSDPFYPAGGWKNVLANPNGKLQYQNREYRELFYETESHALGRPKAGIIMEKNNLDKGLKNFIERLGLTRPDEQREFLDWWIPRLKKIKTDKIFVSILETEEKSRVDSVEISPRPDTFIQFIVYFAPLSDNETIIPLTLPPTPQRNGFTAIEWGGVIAK